MVHRPADSRLLSNLLQQEKDYLKQFNQLFTSSAASLDSFTAYAAASPPPASQVILAVAGLLAAADDALKRYALGVEQWKDAMRVLKDMEEDVGNIMRDREILVTRLIKVSKSHKSNSGTFRDSLLIGSPPHSSSSLSLSVTNHDSSPSPSRPHSTSFTTSTKLAAAQSELQACETHLASKEAELALKRSTAVREGLATRAKAMIQCSRVWEQIGKEILDSLDDLGIIDAHRNEQQPPRDKIGPPSDFSSIGPSQSASQISYPFPEPPPNPPDPELLSDNMGVVSTMPPRRHSIASTAHSSYHTPGTEATYKVEMVTYAPAVSLVVPPSLPSSPREINAPLSASNPVTSSSFGIGLPPPIGYASETDVHTTMYIPAAHAISEYEMPMATVAAGSKRHSRAGSQSQEDLGHQSQRRMSLGGAPAPESTSGPITFFSHTSSSVNRGGAEQKAVPITAVGSALIEVFDEPENNDVEVEDEEEEDSELPVEAEDRLIEQGKLAVVENPRFMSEERRKELEKEREKWMKYPSSDAEKSQQKSEKLEQEPEPESQPQLDEPQGRKSFSFQQQQQQRKRTVTHDTSRVSFAPSVTPKSSPLKTRQALPNTSPSKTSPSKRFLGSLKGFFGGSRPSPPPLEAPQIQDSPLPPTRRSRGDVPPPTPFPYPTVNSDDSDDDSPTTTKTRSGFQSFLWGAGGAAKKKDGSPPTAVGRRWSTRTEKNIRKLTKSGGVGGGGDDDDDDEYDTLLSRNVRNNGIAGDIVVKAGLVGGVGSRDEVKKKRTASGAAAAPGGGAAATAGGGGRKLKKSVPPPIVTAVAPTASTLQATSTPHTTTNPATTRDQAPAPADPSTVSRRPSVKMDGAPKRRSASVDESMRRRRSLNVAVQQGVGEVGQTTPVDGVVDLGKRRRVSSSVIPATNSAAGIPWMMRTPSAVAATSAVVSKGNSSDTAATAAARAPPTITPAATTTTATPSKPTTLTRQSSVGKTQTHPPTSTNPATTTTTATPSKPTTLTRQPSVGKTQTHPPTSTNPPPVETGGSRHQPHVQQPSHPHPQPHRQHSASSSGGGAIVLTAGATQPTGTLISRPGWDSQALPTAGGGLSRNNSVLSGVSGAEGSSSGGTGGMGKKKKQRQTSLGHGMGSGTSLGRKSSLGSSSGHGGSGGGRPVIQPTAPTQSLMSIVEDVAKHNREWSEESSQLYKNRNRIVSGGGGGLLEKEKKMGPVVGMVDVVKAPRSFGRDELAKLDPAMIKARVETSTTNVPPATTGTSGSGGRMVDIKAPGSIFDERKTTATAPARPKVYRQASISSPDLTQPEQQVNLARRPSGTSGPVATSTPVIRSRRPAKSPLRSAMKNPSRTPSPLTSPFLVHKQQQAIQEGSRPANDGVVTSVPVPPAQYSDILGSQQQSSHTPSTTAATNIQPTTTTMANGTASTSTNDSENEIFYTDDEENVDGEAGVMSSTGNHQAVAAAPMLNGHAVGYAGGSDLSHSTTSTAVNRLPPHTTTSPTSATTQPTATHVARRRKSVRVSLQPTFSPSPPAVEYDDKEQPWVWKQDHHHHHHHHHPTTEVQQQQLLHVHAPVPVAAAGSNSLLLNPVQHHRQPRAPPPEPAHDIWEDSDEDVEYQNAKLLLTRAAKKEKEMKVFAARSRS